MMEQFNAAMVSLLLVYTIGVAVAIAIKRMIDLW